ncbi:MAG: hypothetical protein LBI03_04790 [Clostridiales bacterium]|jgi:hypothetical protein|nr:hypothetical protein [Clostridiales bacterium]
MKSIGKSDEVNNAVKKWKEKYENDLEKLNINNYDKTFAAIYAFRSVVLLIDNEIEELERKTNWQTIKLQTPGIEIPVQMQMNTKVHKLINRWDKLDDVGLQLSVIKDLEIKFIDIMRLRYANYMGFINSIVYFDTIPYETD